MYALSGPATPETGVWTKVATVTTASGGTMLVTMSASLVYFYVCKNRKNR